MGLRDLARQGKDMAISKALEVLGERVVGRYGKLLGFTLDSLTRRIDVQVLLKGEEIPVTLSIRNYQILYDGGRSFVVITDVSVSREWMHVLAEDLLQGKRFEIPVKYARILDSLI
jgi:hypothetical protein